MELLNETLHKRFEEVGEQDGKGNEAIVIAKFFNPVGIGTWYITEISEYWLTKPTGETKYATKYSDTLELLKSGWVISDIVLFGWCSLYGDNNDEWGNVMLNELQELKLPLGMSIERDLHCGEITLAQHLK